MYRTGWFGIPGGPASTSKVHIVYDGKCICGAKFSPKSEFQWCANRVYISIVDCKRCKERLPNHLEKINKIETEKQRIEFLALKNELGLP